MTLKRTFEEREADRAYRERRRQERQASARPKIDKDVKLGGPEVVIPKRPKISDAQKLRVHTANEGKCWVCGHAVPVTGPEVQYDHVIERTLTGRDDDDALAPICTVPCHAAKSAKYLTMLAHVKRMGAKHRGETKPKREIHSAGFSDDYQPFPPSRGFRR